MTLTEIIRQDAKWATDSGIDVKVDRGLGTVCITCPDHDDIFMQGDDAEQFIAECRTRWETAGDVDMGLVELSVAKPYAETIWG